MPSPYFVVEGEKISVFSIKKWIPFDKTATSFDDLSLKIKSMNGLSFDKQQLLLKYMEIISKRPISEAQKNKLLGINQRYELKNDPLNLFEISKLIKKREYTLDLCEDLLKKL